jgi:hypothetical protein
VTHGGETYTMEDVCLNAVAPYVYPCYRINSLDCFKEGDYDWTATAQATWFAAVVTTGAARGKVEFQNKGWAGRDGKKERGKWRKHQRRRGEELACLFA